MTEGKPRRDSREYVEGSKRVEDDGSGVRWGSRSRQVVSGVGEDDQTVEECDGCRSRDWVLRRQGVP